MTNFYKKFIGLTAVVALLMCGGLAQAQSDPVKKALEDTQESVDQLISAKDEDSPFDLALRIKTFKQVIDLSILEAEDLQSDFASVEYNEEDEELVEWVSSTQSQLSEAIDYYKNQKQLLADQGDQFTLDKIKSTAEDFKKWRERNYNPLHRRASDFVLLRKGAGVLSTAKERWDKISRDVDILGEFGFVTSDLKDMLISSGEFIGSADDKHDEARDLFYDMYLAQEEASSSVATSSITTSSVATSSSMEEASSTMNEDSLNQTTSTENTHMGTSTEPNALNDLSTSTKDQASSTEDAVDVSSVQDSSIKDLVRSSLEDIREAYRVFIEMSNSVRELLE